MHEIERKFVATADMAHEMLHADEVNYIEQGYIISNRLFEWRLRMMQGINEKARRIHGTHWKTALKFGNGVSRREYEVLVPNAVGKALWNLRQPPNVRKVRVSRKDEWQVDFFYGCLEGLALAEYEMPTTKTYPPLPGGKLELVSDVTDHRVYANKNLARLSCVDAKNLVYHHG